MNYNEKEVLAKETKEVLEYFFLEKNNDYTLNPTRKDKKFSSRKYFEKLLTHEQKYINRRWDENQTIVNYLLGHDKFRLTNTSLNELKKVSVDWSSPNDKGENSLFFLIKKKYDFEQILEIMSDMQINYQQKNIENQYFINYFLKQQDIEEILQQFEKGMNNFPEIRLNKYFQKYLNIIDLFPDLIKDTVVLEKNKFDTIKQLLNNYDFKQFNNNKIGVKLEDTLEKVDKHLNYLFLNNKLKEKDTKIKTIKI